MPLNFDYIDSQDEWRFPTINAQSRLYVNHESKEEAAATRVLLLITIVFVAGVFLGRSLPVDSGHQLNHQESGTVFGRYGRISAHLPF